MTRRQRAALLGLVAAVAAAGVAAVLISDDDDERAEVRSETATTSSTTVEPTTTTSARATSTTAPAPAPTSTSAVPSPGPSATGGVPDSGPTPPPAPTSTVPAPPFRSSIQPVTAEELGSSWREGCPLGPDRLRAVDVSHWGYDGAVHQGRVIVDAAHAPRIVAALRDVYEARFPIERMEPIDRYGGDDQASMRANNTSAFNCRYVSGTTSWSEHSYGRAIDINPLVNPYVKGSTVDPPEGAPYADRRRDDPGMITDGDAVVQAFARQGWRWGGHWSGGKDYQHFSASGR